MDDPIPVICEACGAKTAVRRALLGRIVKCPACGERLTVQGSGSDESDSIESSPPAPLAPRMAFLFCGLMLIGGATAAVLTWQRADHLGFTLGILAGALSQAVVFALLGIIAQGIAELRQPR